MSAVYLDHAATTRPEEAVITAMAACMQECWANPSAVYGEARKPKRELRLARQALAKILRCDHTAILLTSGGTQSNNLALRLATGGHAVVSAIEHSSVLEAAQLWAREVTLVQPDKNGVIQPEAVAAALRKDTALVSVQAANNETGVLQPVEAIGRLLREKRIPFHVDAVQAFGQVPVKAACCDMMSLSAHKFYGPRGAGALYVRPGIEPPALMAGGGQERNLLAGTENVAAVCGMRVAAELAMADMTARADRERALLAQLIAGLRAGIPSLQVLGEDAERLPGVTALHLPGLLAEQAIAALDLLGVMVSGGAACAAASGEASHVYRAMGLTEEAARDVIRISVGRHTMAEEINRAVAAILQVWERYRR